MAPADLLGETWPELCARIGAARLHEWARTEPALAEFTDLHSLGREVRSSADGAWVDRVFAALLRLAAADNGNDRDAALVIAHLMRKGSHALAFSLRDLSADIDAIVAAELWVQIRTYRWQRRHHSHALGLKNDTRAAVLRDLRPNRDRAGRQRLVARPPEVVCAVIAARAEEPGALALGDPAERARDAGEELFDVLAWARSSGVLTDEDLRLLLEFELASMPQRRAAAANWGMTMRGLRRRCGRLKTRLYNARMAYLEQAA